jgi:hypothetical protein
MISPKGMDKLFWAKDMEDVFYWIERLQMVVEVKELDGDKFFKIAKLNLKSKAQDWYHRLDPPPENWRALQALLHFEVWCI